MDCPKCSELMEEVEFQGVMVDRCTQCRGLWFDQGELEKLKKIANSQKLDVGKVAAGQIYDVKKVVSCPRCRVVMNKATDIEQHHIKFETCPTCKGSFLDAGEFKDLKTYDLLDYFKGLFHG